MCGLVCPILALAGLWLYAAMAGSDLVILGEGSLIAVVPRYELPLSERFGSGQNGAIKRALAFGGALSAFIFLFAGLVLPIWAAARLVADAVIARPTDSKLRAP
jgi:hypothetical protein